MQNILVAIISGGLSLICGIIVALITARSTGDQLTQSLKVAQAVTDTKLDTLAEEVKKHNNFATRVPVIEEQIKVINHRIEDLEKGEQEWTC